jgi:A/G-specific adenine glycosylase
LLRHRPDTGVLAGLVELPSTPWLDDPHAAWAAIDRSLPVAARLVELPGRVRHLFTHLDLSFTVQQGRVSAGEPGFWVMPDRFATLALPTLTKKLLRHAGLAC